jgi:exosortase
MDERSTVHPSLREISNDQRIRLRYLISGLILVAALSMPWKALVTLALSNDQYSHIVLAPLIAAALMFFERDRIFRDREYGLGAAIPVFVLGILLYIFERIIPSFSGGASGVSDTFVSPYRLSISALSGLVIVAADFLLCFGPRAFGRAGFACVFLLLTIPVPAPWMSLLVRALQDGSAAFSAVLFRLIHLPALRQDLRFSLPGFDIEIAEQCSGVRSSIALCIASLLAGHLFLRTWWRKLLLVAITIPLVIFKNAVRIVTISSLGVYVSQSFLHGTLHHYSGLPFSLVEVAVVAPLLIRWHRSETQTPRAKASTLSDGV